MDVVRYEPWSLFERLRDEMNVRASESFPLAADADPSKVVTSHWTPAVDIREDDDAFVLTADIPGVDPKKVEITMDNGVLAIKGQRDSEQAKEQDGYRRVERVRGTFYRRFSLPDTADEEHISAKGKLGVLEIRIPKKQKAHPRRIAVS